jgi:hypothetical protein
MERRRLSRGDAAFLIGVPLAWAVLLLFHPSGEGDQVYLDVQDEVAEMLAVHVGMMLFIPLIAVAVYLLLRGVQGTAAKISRIALVPFVVFFSAWETLQGIATGILAAELNGRPQNERGTGAALIQDFAEHPLARDLGVFASIGTLAILIAMIAAGIALRRDAGAPLSVAILLGLFGFLIGAHPPPFGPIALLCFAAAVVLLWRSQGGGLAARSPEPAQSG